AVAFIARSLPRFRDGSMTDLRDDTDLPYCRRRFEDATSFRMPEQQLLAAVDLGSNSFRLMIGRVAPGANGHLIEPLDNLKRTVRLAAGLRDDGTLDAESQTRGVEALARFGERLRSFAP